MEKRICVVTDNEFIFDNFINLVEKRGLRENFHFFYSSFNKGFSCKYKDSLDFRPIRLKNETEESFFSKYDLFLSLHCKQLFPEELVNNHKCINVHPGLNPYNRGWFPQVFSIINKLPVGVTIHEMDKELDHGPIICQQEVEIYDYDTSLDVYTRIQQLEMDMVAEHLESILNNTYNTNEPFSEGNINYKTDFDKICEINPNQQGTFGEFIDLLRATTFAKYDNAYFYDKDGNKIFVSINLKKEQI